MPFQIAVLVSGNGSNLQAILDAIAQKQLENVAVSCVIADRDCFATERAKRSHIPTYTLQRGQQLSNAIHETLRKYDVDLIVLAGFLSILSPSFCHQWNRKIINIHPSLLPKYGGVGMWGEHVHRKVIEDKEPQSGATVHYVTTEVDEGEIIVQRSCPVEIADTVETLANKIHQLEHPLLLEAIKKIATKRI